MHFKHRLTRLRAGVACGALAAAGLALASPAGALAGGNFPGVGKCQGDPVAGAGSTAQNLLQTQLWSQGVWQDYCGTTTPPAITYFSIGSGQGRGTIGSGESLSSPYTTNTNHARDFSENGTTGVRFAASDTAASASQRNDIQGGLLQSGSPLSGDQAVLHELPVTVFAVTVVVHFPEGCTIPTNTPTSTPTAGEYWNHTGNGTKNSTGRFAVSNSAIEKAWEGGETWGQLLPDIAATGSDPNRVTSSPGAGQVTCASLPIFREVRSDKSGTTSVFQQWLDKINSTAWGSFQTGGAGGASNWPDGSSNLNASSGTSGVLSAVQSQDGSIGYAELAQARQAGFNKPAKSGATDDFDSNKGANPDFWLPIQNATQTSGGAAGGWTEPTSDANSADNGTTGANCSSVTFSGIPSPPSGSNDATLSNWDKVSGTNSSTGYGICTPTYLLAFDDNSLAFNSVDGFPNCSQEERKARSVYDYIQAILSIGGQHLTSLLDYSPMPATMQDAATTGANAITWTGSGGCGGNNGGGGNNNNNGGGTNGGNGSGSVAISAATVSGKGVINLTVPVGAGGQIKANGSGTPTTAAPIELAGHKHKKVKKIPYGSASVRVSQAGTYHIRLKPSGAAKKALRRGETLRVKVLVTFKPAGGGTVKHSSRTVTVRPSSGGHKKKH